MAENIQIDAVVIGAGISGLATGKCLQEDGFKVIIIEKTGEVGGLWNYRERDYGVMRCTHINVSKYNYCFSDFPFPDDATDFPHHSEMAQYIVDYTRHFNLHNIIRFNSAVKSVKQIGKLWEVTVEQLDEEGRRIEGQGYTISCKFLAIATGHHASPSLPTFPGASSFTGEAIHSVDYKDPMTNGFVGKRVLVVGIGNSAVDVAVDCATVGRCKSVHISTRSGAWIIPNYVFGFPTDLYACRAFFWLPWKWASLILETVVKLVSGDPKHWGLNPKMRALQTQPTVSPTLIHHIQRKNINIVPNVVKLEGDSVQFVDGKVQQFDKIVYCTGYNISIPFLPEDLREKVVNVHSNSLSMFENVFVPSVGPSLAFIGFVQPASGGVLSMSEVQARWFSAICAGKVSLPSRAAMEGEMCRRREESGSRWYQSVRHTIQQDPIVYCDRVADYFGARPDPSKNIALAWRLLLSSCGPSMYRLQGPNRWSGAPRQVAKVPLTPMMHYSALAIVIILALSVLRILFPIFSLFF